LSTNSGTTLLARRLADVDFDQAADVLGDDLTDASLDLTGGFVVASTEAALDAGSRSAT
jgi:hypothetical protein